MEEKKKTRKKPKSRVHDDFDQKNLFVIKHGLSKFVHDTEWIKGLSDLAQAVSIAAYYVSILHQMHFIRMRGKIGHWNITTIDHTFNMIRGLFQEEPSDDVENNECESSTHFSETWIFFKIPLL